MVISEKAENTTTKIMNRFLNDWVLFLLNETHIKRLKLILEDEIQDLLDKNSINS